MLRKYVRKRLSSLICEHECCRMSNMQSAYVSDRPRTQPDFLSEANADNVKV